MGFWTDKRVLITGGSKGIGRATALRVAEQGAKVVILARGQQALDATLAELNAVSPGHGAVSTDISDPASVSQAVEAAVEVLGGLDVVVSNAGTAQMKALQDSEPELYRKMMDVNYFGSVWLTKAVAPHLWASKGHICYVTSLYGILSTWGASAYASSKFATVGFAESMRQEFLLRGVSTTIFYPTTTETPGLEKENEDKPPIAWAIESENFLNQTYPPEKMAAGITTTIEKARFHSLGAWDSWLIFYAQRWFPSIVRFAVDMDMRNAIKKLNLGPDGLPRDSA